MRNNYLKRGGMAAVALAAGMALSEMRADELGYLHFEKTTGEKTEVPSNGLTITFKDGQLIATPAEGKVVTLVLSELKSMYFSATSTAIKSIDDGATAGSSTAVYNLQGQLLNGQATRLPGGQLPKGVYVVKTKNGETKKVLVP